MLKFKSSLTTILTQTSFINLNKSNAYKKIAYFTNQSLTKRFCSTLYTSKSIKENSYVYNSPALKLDVDREYLSISFYKFIKLSKINLIELRKKMLKDLNGLEVLGRIYIANEGINAQFSCPKDRIEEIETYFKEVVSLNGQTFFGRDITFNVSTLNENGFSKLHVRIKKQIVATNVSEKEYNIEEQPTYLDSEQWHKQLSLLKNEVQSEIGHFEGAVLHDVATFREGMDKLIEDTKDLEEQPIYMYCTGGIRCSKAGSILKSRGFKDVRMLKGGITAYGNFIRNLKDQSSGKDIEQVKSEQKSINKSNVKSLFKGQNFTFDKRRGEPIDEQIISKCHQCGTPTSNYTNCINIICNLLFLQCPACKIKYRGTCGSETCKEPILNKEDNIERLPAVHHHSIRVKPELVIGKLNH